MTIGPGDRKVDDRKTGDRAKDDRSLGRIGFVRLRNRGIEVDALVNILPREPIVLDEMKITPSRQYRDQDTVRQAKQLLAQSKSGKPVTERNIVQVQQRLLSMERQAQLEGRTSDGKELAEALGEVRRANLVNKALETLAKAKKGHVAERPVEALQQQLLGMEQQDQLTGRESEGQRLAEALGEVRRAQLMAEANAMLSRSQHGDRPRAAAIEKMQQRLLGMERQDEFAGRDSPGRQLAEALGAVRRAQLVKDAKDVLASAQRGRRFSDDHIRKLQQLLSSMERQDEMEGRESEGMQLAIALAGLRH